MILSFTTCFIISTKNNQNKNNFSTRNWKRTNDDVVSEKITKQRDTKFNKWDILCEKNIKYFCNLHSQSNITHDIYDNTFHSTYINIYRNPSLNQPYLPLASKIQIFFPPVNIISQADKNLIFLAERSFAPTRVSTFQI